MQLRIERLGHRGDGIAPGPIFAPRTLPGELVEGEVTGDRMAAPTVIEPSRDRVKPECPNYDACGGCDLMHADDAFVGRWKVGIVRQALEARGLPAPIVGVATSSARSRRRAVLSAKGGTVGFHGRRSHELVDVTGCRVLVPEIEGALPVLARIARAAGSARTELSLTVIAGRNGLDVAVRGGPDPSQAALTDLTGIAAEADLARLTVNGELVARSRAASVSFAGVLAEPPPGGFLQATRHGESALLACVSKALGQAGRVADLFSGCGTFALPISRRAEVHAVEGDPDLLEAAAAAWRHTKGHRKLTTERRDLFRDPLAAAELSRFDGLVIDPPRAGAEAQCRELAESDVPRVAGISCNPLSFARDAEILIGGGYRLDWIRVVDQFRWSPHVEVAAAFQRS
ncbi:23S rRNA m(5)U-1939 methyltransferase [Palleronia marisminoris]|uniref:23S rRNA (Uracil(1939)-C(5))-methyltransferase RlmD n=1 Tax=Palleronia marisminoris TaxID=315423 RepID=A0A1Y5SWZ5_9RHOB|nr:class I SAM-dependent RNA methyltransferase [Palleronia marisminoris]SFH05303.1 23S rRNA m(5)U-1939 methyltransferase [Palleronia marisminoris]SLN50674.1 23S rRNA (uracil(1939)-C(5))-methyltransferase RlmD [Palleronia marisminoris]